MQPGVQSLVTAYGMRSPEAQISTGLETELGMRCGLGQEENSLKLRRSIMTSRGTDGFWGGEGFLSFAGEPPFLPPQGMEELSFPRTPETADSQMWN